MNKTASPTQTRVLKLLKEGQVENRSMAAALVSEAGLTINDLAFFSQCDGEQDFSSSAVGNALRRLLKAGKVARRSIGVHVLWTTVEDPEYDSSISTALTDAAASYVAET